MAGDTLRKPHKELTKQLQAYQAAVDVAAIASITDLSGRITYVNDKFIEVSQYSSEELVGNTYRIVNSGHHPPDFFKELWETIKEGKPWRGEIKNKAKDGSYYWVDTVITGIPDEKNNITQYFSIGTVGDITEKNKTENILKESESLYKNLFNNSPFPNAIIDRETMQCLEVNETAVRLYGYSREEFLQLTAFDIRVPEEHAKLKKQLKKGIYASDTSIRSHKKKNGEVIQVEPSISEISYKGKKAFLATVNDVTEKIQLQEQLMQASINRKNEISRASMEAQEKNRADIGRELHDNVNQLLAAALLCLKNIQPASKEDEKLIEKGTQATNEAINEIRKLSWSLVPPSLKDLSLHDSIENLALDLKLVGATVEFDMRIYEELINEGLKVNIFRIIQEQFSNITKYAAASKVKIAMTHKDGLLTLEITDNGKGFDTKQKSKGIGLNNIIHRAEAYNGEVTIESSPGHGCSIHIEFST